MAVSITLQPSSTARSIRWHKPYRSVFGSIFQIHTSPIELGSQLLDLAKVPRPIGKAIAVAGSSL